MISANDKVNALHAAFQECTGRDVPMTMTAERWWAECVQEGLTPQDLRNVIRQRQKAIAKGVRYSRSLALINICGSSEAILNTLDEAAECRARIRLKLIDPARTEVLHATGRPTEVPSEPAKQAGELPLIQALRKAAQ